MAEPTKFIVQWPGGAYDTAQGGTVDLDATDPLVRLNIKTGIITPAEPAKTPAVKCPACLEYGAKRPTIFHNAGELSEHYSKHHPALEPPAWEEE